MGTKNLEMKISRWSSARNLDYWRYVQRPGLERKTRVLVQTWNGTENFVMSFDI
jgi:hypothetical protein